MSQPEAGRLIGWSRVRMVILGADLVALGLALAIAYGRFEIPFLPDVEPSPPILALLCLVTWITFSWLVGLYRQTEIGSGLGEYQRVFVAGLYSVVAIATFDYFDSAISVSRGFLVLFWVAGIAFVSTGRFLVRGLVGRLAQRGLRLRRVLIVGANPQGVGVARELRENRAASAEVVGFLDDYQPLGSVMAGLPVLGEPTALYEVAERTGATHAIVIQAALGWESLTFLVATMHRRRQLSVLLAPGLFDVGATPLEATQLGGALLLRPHPSRIVGFEAVAKRALDLAIVIPVLLLTLPLQAVIFSALLLSGRRPLLIFRRVLGRGGRPLTLPGFSGGRIRQAHLSRLPSLWLVLVGAMSLIGPRPIARTELPQYERWYDILSALKPGFIGPWWLAGQRRPIEIEQEVVADLTYARSYRVWMDFQILCQVLMALVRPRPDLPPPSQAIVPGT